MPYLGAWLLKPPAHAVSAKHLDSAEMFDTPFYRHFRAWVIWCVTHRWKTIGITIALVVLGMVGMGKVQQKFFPDSSRPEIMAPWQVIVKSAVRRLRPIVLTAAAAVLAMIPLSRSIFGARWRWPSWAA